MLQFVDEDGDWVELVVLIRFHGGGGSVCGVTEMRVRGCRLPSMMAAEERR